MALQKAEIRAVRWRKVKAPRAWKPVEPSELIGEYVGTKMHQSRIAGDQPYAAIYVQTSEGVYYVTGTVLVNLMNAAFAAEGDLLKIVFLGYKQSGSPSNSHEYKDFDLYVEQKGKAPRAVTIP